MILTIRTDNPQAELGLYEGNKETGCLSWRADRNLSADIHNKLEELFKKAKTSFSDLDGIILYKGPGSFTGLRIGASVANALAFELDIPIAGANTENWVKKGTILLDSEPGRRLAELEYGSEPKTTKPKK